MKKRKRFKQLFQSDKLVDIDGGGKKEKALNTYLSKCI